MILAFEFFMFLEQISEENTKKSLVLGKEKGALSAVDGATSQLCIS